MEFEKYRSLTNVYNQKTIDVAVDAGYANLIYSVTEKIHGANFGIHWDRETDTIRFSRRSAFLEEGESFYSHTRIADALLSRMRELVHAVADDVKTIVVYGELYGGILNGQKAEGAKTVQKEVQYSPDTQFAAFDLVVNGEYMSQKNAYFILGELYNFHMAPLIGLFEGLEKALEVPNDLQSRVPVLLGYEVEGDNVSEGVVIRPWVRNITLPNGNMFILKNKNAKFTEKDTAKVAKPQEPMSEKDEGWFTTASSYITVARLNAVISKESELTQKDFGRIMGLFTQDAINDLEEELSEQFNGPFVLKESVDDWKRVNKALQKEAANLVREYWLANF